MRNILLIFISFLIVSLISSCTSKKQVNKNVDDINLFNMKEKELVKESRKKSFPILFKGNSLTESHDGGISIYQSILNISDKTIKYLYITYKPYNNKYTFSETKKETDRTIIIDNPIRDGEYHRGFFANVWKNINIQCVNIKKLRVVFMDDSSKEFTEDEIPMPYYRNSSSSKKEKCLFIKSQ